MNAAPATTPTPDALNVPFTLRALAAFTGVFNHDLHDLAHAYEAAALLAHTTIRPRDGDPVYSAMNALQETLYPHENAIENEIRSRFDASPHFGAGITTEGGRHRLHGQDVIQQFTYAHDQTAFALGFALCYRIMQGIKL